MAVLSIGQMWATDYELVTSTDDLEAGANYVIGSAASGSGVFMSTTERNNNRGVTSSITISESKITGTSELLVLELGGTSGAWTFLTTNYAGTDGYLGCGTGNKDNHCKINASATDYCKFTISFSSNKAVITSTGRTDRNIMRYNSSNNPPIFACYSSGQNDIYLYKEVTNATPASVATPTFSVSTGTYAGTQSVTLACETEGSTIYYTTDGSTPDNNSTEYTEAISVSSSQTIKAIAYVGSDASSVASAEYTILTPQTTMDQIFAVASADEGAAKSIAITFNNWVVSGAKGNTAYVTDGQKGFIVYYSGHGFQEGDILSGTAIFTITLYKGAAELTAKLSGTVNATTGGTATLNVLDADGITALSGINTGSLIKISGEATSTSVVAGVTLYKTIYPESSLPNLTVGKNYNCTGVYVQYNSTKEMMPRQAADIEEVIPTFTVTYNNAPDHGTLTIKNGDDVVASGSAINEGTVLDIITTHAEGYKLVGVTVNGSAYAASTLTLTENVTIAASFEENEAPLVTSYILSEIGVETSHLNGEHVGDKVNLPLTAASCSKVFRGWSANASCAVAPEYAPGAEITLAANNKFYAVYADAHVITPTDHALGSATFLGSATGGNTASEGYTLTTNKTNDKSGYTQDSGTKDADIVHLQIKAESQIINEEPSAIIVTAHLGAGADRDELTYPVNAMLVDADGNNVGDPVVLTNSIPDKAGDDFSANLPTANYADVRGVKISHMKEDGWNVRYYSMSFKYQTGGTTYDNYSTECQAQVATPVISGVTADGVYDEGKEISITCATDGATIYYAVDSDEEPSTEYTGAFTVDTDGAHTVKAKAVKTDMADSEIASVSFTINLPVVLSTMDAIYEAATEAGGTATDANIAFGNWVVSGVSTNGKNVFVTDGTKGFIIFDNGASMGFAVGDVLSGTVACKVQLYNGAAELTTLSSSTEGLSIAKEGVVTPVVKAINALSGINTGAPIIINSVQFDGTNLSDGAYEIKPYNSLFAYEALENGSYYNVTGIYQQFGSTKEILPRSAADIVKVTLSDPEISYTPASATIELGQSLPGTVFANPHELAISYGSNNESVATVTDAGVISLAGGLGTAVITASFAGDATYAAGNATYTITVTPASENVVILAQYGTKYYAMSTKNASSAFTAIEVEYDGTQITVNSQEDKDSIQWARKTSGDNTTFQVKDEYKKYMKGTSDGAAMTLNANVCNWGWDGTNEYYYIGSRTFFYQNGVGFKNYATSNIGKSGYSGKAQVIVIDPANIVITTKVSAELAYDPASVVITQGDALSAPSLVNPHTVAITSYASDNEAVATVTDGGVIALAGGIGTAHITAHFAGDATYLEGDAVYTITVNEAGDDLSGTWTLASSVAAGDKIIIANVAVAGELLTMGAQNGSYREQVASTVDGENKLTPAEGTKVFTLVDASNFGSYEGFALQASNGNYLSSASNSSNNIKEVASVSDANAVWSIEISEGVAAIVAQGSYARKVIRYNSNNTRFSCYAEENSMADVVIYKHGAPEPPTPVYETVRNELTPGNYYTICYPKAMTDVQGATLWSFVGKDANFAYIEQETATTIEAGKPYIMYATASTVTAVLGDETSAPGANGAIHGTFSNLTQDQLNTYATVAGNDLYLVIGNELRRATGEGTGSNTLPANRAFVVLGDIPAAPAHMPAHVRAMPMHKDTATGLDALNASEKPVKMVINGQIFILRGEKLYDATGRLVK